MRLPEALGLALVTLGSVMIENEIPADDAWSDEYRAQHRDYLIKAGVPITVVDEMIHKTAAELFAFVLNP
jgi:hypothetical protein